MMHVRFYAASINCGELGFIQQCKDFETAYFISSNQAPNTNFTHHNKGWNVEQSIAPVHAGMLSHMPSNFRHFVQKTQNRPKRRFVVRLD